jgi:NADPH-dependent ferric siderophore reductase
MSEPRRRRSAYAAAVLRTEQLSATLVRLVVGGPGLRGFQSSEFADSYVKVVFVHPDAPRPLPRTADRRVDLDGLRDTQPAEQAPRIRSYTVRDFDADSRELTLDFVVHGDEGVAGPWADDARPGDEILLMGPGGGYSPDPTAGWHLLAGDLSVLPAIAVALERLPETAHGHAVVEVHDELDEVDLTVPPGVELRWVHDGGARPGTRLVEAVRALPWLGDDVQAFVHGEAAAVKDLRRYLHVERGLPLERLSISGYWRLGLDDEGWRAAKRDWNAAIERDEAISG